MVTLPVPGDSFPLLTFGSETGVFSGIVSLPQADWQANYDEKVFSLKVTGLAPPYLTLGALPATIDTNGFNLILIGPIGSNYTIEASTDLKSWLTLGSFTTTFSSINFNDASATNYPQRFYRALFTP